MNCRGRLLDLSSPVVMGILNLTPDSFFDGGRYPDLSSVLSQAEKMLHDGAVLLDVGGASSRPGAVEVPENEELSRVVPVIEVLAAKFPEAYISIDTWRARVAREAIQAGACIVNDISAWELDPNLLPTVAELQVPYILMHMQGRPGTMQQNPQYEEVTTDVLDFLIRKIEQLEQAGVYDLVIDPGFGFGKTLEHNFELLKNLNAFVRILQRPVLAGISRKSMICKTLGVKPADALNGTTALHMVALQQGAAILRVHDVKEAVEVIQLWKALN